jgi:hypothetical protein
MKVNAVADVWLCDGKNVKPSRLPRIDVPPPKTMLRTVVGGIARRLTLRRTVEIEND